MMQPPPLGAQSSCPSPSSTFGTVCSWVSSCLLRTQLTRPFLGRRLQVAAPPRGRDQRAAWVEISWRHQLCSGPREGQGPCWPSCRLRGGNSWGFCVRHSFRMTLDR